ncbi:MAG: dihydroneopterin aldolase [Parvibaculaceae bacterium]
MPQGLTNRCIKVQEGPTVTQSKTSQTQTNDLNSSVTPLRIADEARSVRHVFIRDLVLDMEIGVYETELDLQQPVRFNVDLTVSESPHGDDYANVVCYDQVVQQIKALLIEGRVNLVETLAEMIAGKCLEDERVLAARIRVEKLAAIPEAAAVGVEIERRRPQ